MATKQLLVDLDFKGNEIKNVLVHRLASAPTDPKAGQIYYDTAMKKFRYYDGTNWINGTNITAKNKKADSTGNYGVFSNVNGDEWVFRNIKGATGGKITITLTAEGEIEIDANISKDDVGLGNVTNDKQVKASEKGVADGVATLGSDGKVPAVQLPSYVDDVIEFEKQFATPAGMIVGKLYYNTSTKKFIEATSATAGTNINPESGKIYIDKSTDKQYRWSGSGLSVISETLALGETASTAFAGDKGKEAYDHISDTTKHITEEERTKWNKAPADTDVTLADPTATNTQISAGTGTIKARLQAIINQLAGVFAKFSITTGHDHDGVNSKKVSFTKLTDTSSVVQKYVATGITGATGTITAAIHKCGTTPQVSFLMNGEDIILGYVVNATGDISWSSNKAFVAGDVIKIIVQG